MSFTRADPIAADDTYVEPEYKPKPTPKPDDIKGFLVRHPVWVGNLVKEAAEVEGLSVNQWLVRVMAEQAKRSKHQGWRTMPMTENPTTHVQAKTVVIDGPPVVLGTPKPEPEPESPEMITPSPTPTSDFSVPEDDIPEF